MANQTQKQTHYLAHRTQTQIKTERHETIEKLTKRNPSPTDTTKKTIRPP